MRTILATFLLLAGIPLLAIPSGLTWIPNTDIQTTKVWHLYSGTFIYNNGGGTPPFVEEGILYGPLPNVEVGVDTASGFTSAPPASQSLNPVWFNAKLDLIAATDKMPLALAVGGYDFSPDTSANGEIIYGAGAYTLYGWRLTGGVYDGNKDVIGTDHKGFIGGIDHTMGKWWISGDFQSGKNLVGCANVGVGYNFTDKIQVIVGYDHYNSPSIVGAKSSVNVQFGVNL